MLGWRPSSIKRGSSPCTTLNLAICKCFGGLAEYGAGVA
jgi:hypothetical protein